MPRSAELSMLTSKEFLDLVKDNKFRLVTFSDLVKTIGLDKMKSPVGQ